MFPPPLLINEASISTNLGFADQLLPVVKNQQEQKLLPWFRSTITFRRSKKKVGAKMPPAAEHPEPEGVTESYVFIRQYGSKLTFITRDNKIMVCKS